MGASALHFSNPSPGEQVTNGVETGFSQAQAFELLDKLVEGWGESSRLDGQLLRAICSLSIASPEQASDGFSSNDIVDAVTALRGRRWSSTDDGEQMSTDVRKQWNKLLALWEKKAEGIEQAFTDAGLGVRPSLAKTEGGGAGRTSKYRVEWRDALSSADEQEPGGYESFGVPTAIRYVCEDLEDTGPIVGLIARGYRLEGWRRGVFAAAVIIPIVALVAVSIIALLQLSFAKTLDGKQIMSAVMALGTVGVIFWSTTGRILRLADRKIVLAPWWMQSVDDDRLLERREPPRYQGKSIKAVRYASACPICRGKITVRGGGIEFWGRLVGRCEHAPVEHVFSFDHVTRSGRPLR